jgi:hypothetical protein
MLIIIDIFFFSNDKYHKKNANNQIIIYNYQYKSYIYLDKVSEISLQHLRLSPS